MSEHEYTPYPQPVKAEVTFNNDTFEKLGELARQTNLSYDVLIERALRKQMPLMGKAGAGEFATDADYYEFVSQNKK